MLVLIDFRFNCSAPSWSLVMLLFKGGEIIFVHITRKNQSLKAACVTVTVCHLIQSSDHKLLLVLFHFLFKNLYVVKSLIICETFGEALPGHVSVFSHRADYSHRELLPFKQNHSLLWFHYVRSMYWSSAGLASTQPRALFSFGSESGSR